jgi:tetratricopeptide (TPR) repeat protein
LKLDGDSVKYYNRLAFSEFCLRNYAQAIEIRKKGYAIDSNHIGILFQLGIGYMILGQYDTALKYFKKQLKRLEVLGYSDTSLTVLTNLNRIGYVYWQIGYKEKAEYYFAEQINKYNRINELGRGGWKQAYSYYHLAGTYAFKGERDKAYENLRTFNQRQSMPFHMPTLIKIDPLFENIRDDQEFQQIVRDIEAKYQAEHERVKKWLEENDML